MAAAITSSKMLKLGGNFKFLATAAANNCQRCLSVSAAQCGKNDFEINPEFTNRNPRNLEQMMIARKPLGFEWDTPKRSYWYKLDIDVSARNIKGQVVHNDGSVVTKASSTEWGIKKQLVSTSDISCAMNVGRTLARRCLESGILAVHVPMELQNSSRRVQAFIRAFEEAGVDLKEPQPFTEEEVLPPATLYR